MAWTYEQLFNGLTDGTLGGQDSWTATGGTQPFSVSTNAQCRYEGAKGLDTGTGSGNYRRAITAVTDGTVYYCTKYVTSNAAGDGPYFGLKKGGSFGVIFKIYQSGGVDRFAYETSGITNIQNVSSATFYVIGINFDTTLGTNGQFRYSIDGGAFSSFIEFGNSMSGGITGIELGMDTGSGWAGCIDTITPTDPLNPVGTATYSTELLMGI